MKKISLIGSTGSIGRQVLEVCRRYPDRFQIVALVANADSRLFQSQVEEFKPKSAALYSVDKSAALSVCEMGDIVFNAASGFAGLEYSLAAIEAKKPLALANKETLVCGGEYVTDLARANNVEIIPVDSEHSAIWQCLNFDCSKSVRRLIITASGGAFRGKTWSELESVTPEMALNHPTWKMGKKITIDSATLANKGYEVIEAHILYGTPYEKIETVIQPQSIVHSLVEFEDGAVVAQMSYPTMELPIQLAMTYPERLAASLKPMDFKSAFSLDFEPMNRRDFPLFDLAVTCGEQGGVYPLIFNAADEVAVNGFLSGKISFNGIYGLVNEVVNSFSNEKVADFSRMRELDLMARKRAERLLKR